MPNVDELLADWNSAMATVRDTIAAGREKGFKNPEAQASGDDNAWHRLEGGLARAEELAQRIDAARGQSTFSPEESGTISERLAVCEAWGNQVQPRKTKAILGGFMSTTTDTVPTTRTGSMLFRSSTGSTIRTLAPSDRLSGDTGDCAIGEYITAKLTGGDVAHFAGSMTTTDVEGGGSLLTPAMSTRMVDLARANSVCIKAGAQTMPMVSPEVSLARVTADPTSHWRPEGSTVTASGMTFDRVTLRSKTLAAIVPVSLEMMEDVRNLPQVIESSVSQAMGVKLDYACLSGAGAASEPRGIYNYTTVNSVTSIGTPDDYTDVSSAVGEIMADNFPDDPSKLAWVMHPQEGENYDQLTDTTGQPLRPTPWVEKLRRFTTTSIDTTLGGSGNESWGVVGDFREMLIGMRTTGVMIRILDAGTATDADSVTHNAVSDLKFFVVAHMRADVALMRPTWFCKMTGILA